MQIVSVHNLTTRSVNINGLGPVAAESVRYGVIRQDVFDTDFDSYAFRACGSGILVIDKARAYKDTDIPTSYAQLALITAAGAVTATHRLALVTAASANYALDLPAASAVPAGTTYYFYFESGGFTATITANGSDAIDAGTTLPLATGTPIQRIQSNGVDTWTSV